MDPQSQDGGSGKNVLMAVVLCVAVLVGWQMLSPYIFPPPEPVVAGGAASLTGSPGTGTAATASLGATGTAATFTATGTGTAAATAAGTGVSDETAAPDALVPGRPPPAPAPRPEETFAVIEDAHARIEISTRGATLHRWELKNPDWLQTDDTGATSSKNVLSEGPEASPLSIRPFQLQLISGPFGYPSPGFDDYAIISATAESMVMRWTDPGGAGWVEKRFTLDPTRPFYVDVELAVHNATGLPVETKPGVILSGFQDPNSESERGFLNPIVDATVSICHVADDVERRVRDDELIADSIPGVVRWFGIDHQYFLLSVIPDPNPTTGECELVADPAGETRTALKWTAETVAPGAAHTWSMDLYGGPKTSEELSLANATMDVAIDYGMLAILCKPLIWLMKVFFDWFGNWGLAILLVTLVVRGSTFYWNQKAYRSMQDMARLKPEMDRVKKKFENDKVRLNQELSALMKANNVNPLGGCLPMLLPMPIFFALYYTIYYSAELYRAPFLWITDLSAPDPIYVFPVLTMLTMVISGLLTPQTTDNAQAKMIRWVMPLMFGGFMIVLPSALAVYYFMSTALGIFQQWYVRNKYGSMKPVQGPEARKKPAEIKSAKDLVQSIKDGEAERVNAAVIWMEAISTGLAEATPGQRNTMLKTRDTYVKAVRPLLSRSDAEVTAAAARLLGGARDEESVPRLLTLLTEGNGAQRKAAIEALGKIGAPEARGPLRQSMKLTRFWEYPSIIAALTAIQAQERASATQGKT